MTDTPINGDSDMTASAGQKIRYYAMIVVLAGTLFLWLYSSFVGTIVWSIHLYTGPDPCSFTPHPGVQTIPVLRSEDVDDVPADFVADPFMLCENGRWYMFFEVLNSATGQGDIGLATSVDGLQWQYEHIVLDEPFHLSYPYVFKWRESFYMIPEAQESASIRLYKATGFPHAWELADTLLTGNFLDPSVVFKDNTWWLFALQDNEVLVLYHAPDLSGPWTAHPSNPLVENDRDIDRPGGRIVMHDGRLIRYAQDGEPDYGNAVRAFQVDRMSAAEFSQHEIADQPVLEASGSGWNALGMHHIDPHRLPDGTWTACVDGKTDKIVFDLRAGAERILRKMKKLLRLQAE